MGPHGEHLIVIQLELYSTLSLAISPGIDQWTFRCFLDVLCLDVPTSLLFVAKRDPEVHRTLDDVNSVTSIVLPDAALMHDDR